MSYEFNPDSQLFEFPNPYKVENTANLVAGGGLMLAGAIVLFSVREHLAHGLDARALTVLALALMLLVFGIGMIARALTQLRFFFGRNRPDSLAQTVAADKDGDTERAAAYKETLRQNALIYREPTGALNGLLYSWLPHLIFAPRVIQDAAQTQFYNFLALAATLLSFALCWLMLGQGEAQAWVGLIYGGFAFVQIMRPMLNSHNVSRANINDEARVGVGGLIVLIVLAILGPVLLNMLAPRLPNLGTLSVTGEVMISLVCAIGACAVFGLALKNQLQEAPRAVGAARVTETVTMNAHPNKLIEELDRVLMTRWFNNIPNRRYTRKSPNVAERRGQFTAEIFEETQPRPQAGRIASGVTHALASPQFFWLACLSGLATVFILAGALAALVTAHHVFANEALASPLTLMIGQFTIGMFSYRAAHTLWGRFDFVSELIWVDISGSYESANVHIGNQFASNVQTVKDVINIESMTMRVWVSEIDTVIFGKDAGRQMIGMRGLQSMADDMAAALKAFGETRSMVVAPTSNQDMQRAQNIGTMNQLLANQGEQVQDITNRIAAAVQGQTGVQEVLTKTNEAAFCTKCGFAITPEASFCGGCGQALKSKPTV